MEKTWVDLKRAAQHMAISYSKASKEWPTWEKEAPAHRFGRKLLFKVRDLDRMIEGCRINGLVLAFLLISTAAQASTASWYGVTGDTCDPWKHTVTASGEKFNENALTAASWSYPLGSRIKVTNLRNGHAVVVRCNDRGPGKKLYRAGRIVDLSRGAFEAIADLDEGVIPVKVVLLKKGGKHAKSTGKRKLCRRQARHGKGTRTARVS